MAVTKTKDSAGKPRPRPKRGRPRQVPIDEQRECILAAATEVFAAEGFDGATSERIAEASGVGRPSVYQLFGSKNDVFIAAVERGIRRMLELTSRSLLETAHFRGRKQAKANIATYFEFVTQEPATFRLILLAASSGDAATCESALGLRRGMQEGLARYILQTWEGFQALEPRDATLAATLMLHTVESAAIYHLEHKDRTTEEAVQFTADFIWASAYDLAVGHDLPAGRRAAFKNSK